MLFWISWGHMKKVVHGDLLKVTAISTTPTVQVACVVAERVIELGAGVSLAVLSRMGDKHRRREMA